MKKKWTKQNKGKKGQKVEEKMNKQQNISKDAETSK